MSASEYGAGALLFARQQLQFERLCEVAFLFQPGQERVEVRM
jgi:hypothetical protein